MTLEISSALLGRLLAEAQAAPGLEVCGLLFGTSALIAAAEPCANVAPDPARAFEIDPAALFAAHRRARAGGSAPIGHYHSHPTGRAEPSATDAAGAMGDGAVWLILAGQDARAWRTVKPGAFEAVEFDVVTSQS
ncbi:M67 family metallopeptidase [Sphingomonas endolithica]|uniref:M67 family metallopeptidase n=1 Tax=Sphingomonas endolithica TaxID=2972485 RepID=UPI0021AF6B7C|nr:M67 family metallopeptidase [Sphingomonas sp. ZFBP2030]